MDQYPLTMEDLLQKQRELMDKVPHGISELTARRMVAAWGIVEEVAEYLNSTGHKPWRPYPLTREEQLEEIADVQFFNLELIILSEFTWEEITSKYVQKHAVNLERYRRAQEGDYSWDDRSTKEGL